MSPAVQNRGSGAQTRRVGPPAKHVALEPELQAGGPVEVDHALRFARRARAEEDQARITGTDHRSASIDRLVERAGPGEQVGPGPISHRGAPLEEGERRIVDHRGHIVTERPTGHCGLGEHPAHRAPRQELAQLVGRGEGRERHGDAAGQRDPEERGDRLGSVAHHDRDAGSQPGTPGDERLGDPARFALQVAVAPPDRRAVLKRIVEHQCLASTVRFTHLEQEAAQGQRAPPRPSRRATAPPRCSLAQLVHRDPRVRGPPSWTIIRT